MGSGGSGTSGGATNIGGTQPIRATGAPRRTQGQRFRDDAAQAMVRQQQQRGRNPVGGMNLTAEERRMRAPQSGLAPGDVLATIGTSGYGQVAAAKLAGRTDISKEQLGDLATRTNIGQLPAGRVSVPGVGTAALNVLNVVSQLLTQVVELLVRRGSQEPSALRRLLRLLFRQQAEMSHKGQTLRQK
jgi:hypothetical protein